MKLDELYTDTISTVIEDVEYSLTFDLIEEGIGQIKLQSQPSLVSNIVGGTTSFVKKHPIISAAAVLWVTNAISQYNKNKRLTTNFYAKTEAEKKTYEKIVKDLMATGHYELLKGGYYVDGGKLWTLKRKGI